MRFGLSLCGIALAMALMTTSGWADIPLSGAQINAHVSGNTLEITTKNLEEARGYFNPDGTVKGREGEHDFVGKWRVYNDMLCLDIPQFDHEFCRTVVVRGDQIFLFTERASLLDVSP